MPYETILTHLDSSPASTQRVAMACELAKRQQAYLVGVAPTGVATIPSAANLGGATAVAQLQNRLDEAARQAVARFESQCREAGLDSVEARQVSGSTIEAVLRQARFSDLVVVSQSGGEQDPATPGMPGRGFVEQVLMGSGRPVLVVPALTPVKPVGDRVVFAWDASRESARAASDALPLFRGATLIDIVVVNSAANGGATSLDTGNDIALYLARHGVSARISQVNSPAGVAKALLTHATKTAADLLVMGGYGHSRMREWVLGGTTRTMLNTTTIPILMTH